MASLYKSLSRPTLSLVKSRVTKHTAPLKSKPSPSLLSSPTSSFPSFSRSVRQLGALQSLIPLHSAVSSARLTSCLGVDSRGSRSLSQGMLCGANPGV